VQEDNGRARAAVSHSQLDVADGHAIQLKALEHRRSRVALVGLGG